MSFRSRKENEAFMVVYFWPVSQRVQINFIFTDNECILSLSCNVKMSKTNAKLSEKSRNKRHSDWFKWCPLSHLHLYCYRFLPSLYLNQVPENLSIGH